jgi:hypothetical protein
MGRLLKNSKCSLLTRDAGSVRANQIPQKAFSWKIPGKLEVNLEVLVDSEDAAITSISAGTYRTA